MHAPVHPHTRTHTNTHTHTSAGAIMAHPGYLPGCAMIAPALVCEWVCVCARVRVHSSVDQVTERRFKWWG